MSFYGHHGVLPEERKIGQRFLVDVTLNADLYEAGVNDRLDQTINYAEVYTQVRRIVEGPPCQLIEAVAQRIADRLLSRFPTVVFCKIRVIKPDPPIAGYFDSMAVEIDRERTIVYLGLGSNLGDRSVYLRRALEKLDNEPHTRVISCSSIYETDPYGPVTQGDYLNMVAGAETVLPPRALLRQIHVIEQALDRKRDVHWGPRTIDIDILTFGSQVTHNESLSIPHPEISRRAFVLKPFAEIAPHLVIPGTHHSLIELWQMLDEKEGARLWRKNNGEGKFGLFAN
jgi:dihydroneopterin aldolase/2-amino-4-hydroxy-6-hydroxymethyldihydropteridine diphosphokinase